MGQMSTLEVILGITNVLVGIVLTIAIPWAMTVQTKLARIEEILKQGTEVGRDLAQLVTN